MDPIRDDLLADLAGLTSGAPDTALISTVTGEPAAAGELDAEYWWRNIRNPVRFAEGMAAAGRRRFPHLRRDRAAPGAAGLSARRAARAATPKAACSARSPAGRARRTRFRQSPPAFTSRDTTSSGRRGSTAPPSRTGCRSTRGTGSGSGSSARSRPATRPTRTSTIRCSVSGRPGRCGPGSTISMPTSCRGSPITPSRGFRCCRAPRSSRWRWPRRGCAGRMPPRSK